MDACALPQNLLIDVRVSFLLDALVAIQKPNVYAGQKGVIQVYQVKSLLNRIKIEKLFHVCVLPVQRTSDLPWLPWLCAL